MVKEKTIWIRGWKDDIVHWVFTGAVAVIGGAHLRRSKTITQGEGSHDLFGSRISIEAAF